MHRVWSKAVVVAVLVLMLERGWSWGAPPNNDVSDSLGNTAGGSGALESNTTGSNNTALGTFALQSNTGSHNTIGGYGALLHNTSGGDNTAVGYGALGNNDIGGNNIAIGVGAGSILQEGSRNIYLGHSGVAVELDTMRLGMGQTYTFIDGIAGATVSNSAPVLIDTNTGRLGTMQSSARYKSHIQTMGTRSERLFQLRPVTFRYKDDGQGERHYGLIAEEVVKVYPELVTRGAHGEVEAVRYQELIPMLLNEVQHQQRQLAMQAQELATLKAQNAHLRAVVAQQQEREAAVAARLERLEAAVARAGALASR